MGLHGQTQLDNAWKAYEEYDLGEARSLVQKARAKAGKKSVELADAEELTRRINTADNFLERVEHIKIIDSIAVPKGEFFKAYRLPASAGRLSADEDNGIDYLFTSEGGDYRIWAAPDTLGNLVLTESSRLTDGSWSEAEAIEDLADDGADVAFPFMMPDGVTLYYASKSDEGLGGYDIMVASRDVDDGSFLQPQNMGMPYNSPYDDYLLAVDELNGVGWFASDRNRLGDNITIYVFQVNDMRRNYPADTENLESLALLRDWRLTHEEGDDFTELLDVIAAINPDAATKSHDFRLPMDGGVVYTSYSDFRSSSASALMEKYVERKKEYDALREEMADLRRQYHRNPSQSLRENLRQKEQESNRLRESLRRSLSDVYRAERQQQ